MAHRFIAGFDPVCTELIEALGLKDHHCRSFSMDFPMDDVVTVKVEMIATEDQVKACAAVFKEYQLQLVEIDEPEPQDDSLEGTLAREAGQS